MMGLVFSAQPVLPNPRHCSAASHSTYALEWARRSWRQCSRCLLTLPSRACRIRQHTSGGAHQKYHHTLQTCATIIRKEARHRFTRVHANSDEDGNRPRRRVRSLRNGALTDARELSARTIVTCGHHLFSDGVRRLAWPYDQDLVERVHAALACFSTQAGGLPRWRNVDVQRLMIVLMSRI